VNAPRITDKDQLFKSDFTFCLVYVFTLQAADECAFTIDPSTPTLRINLNEHPIFGNHC
jgi:hypothetical protein